MIEYKLKRLLGYNELTQKQFAEKTDIRLPTISDICNNKCKMISTENINKICKHLNCQPSDFIIFTPD